MNKSAEPDPNLSLPSGQGREILGIMAKYWTPGEVKTRLGTSIGNEASANLHRLFVSHLCRQLESVGSHREVVVAPESAIPAMSSRLSSAWSFRPQTDGDLGARMQAWFSEAFQTGRFDRAVLIGADCPTLRPVEMETALAILKHHHVVLGPASDGGYYLIGLQKPPSIPETHTFTDLLFNGITWSGDHVLSVTQQRIDQSGRTSQWLPQKSDVDNVDDLLRLRDQLERTRESYPSDGELAVAINQLMQPFDSESVQ